MKSWNEDMKRHRPTRSALFAVMGGILFFSWSAQAEAGESTLAYGERLATNCFTCHGDGVANLGDIPSLTGLSAARIKSVLADFQTGHKPATIMNRISKGYSDAEIAAIAAYLENADTTRKR